MDDKEIRILRAILLDWEYQLDIWAEGRISTKFSRVQDDLRSMIGWLDDKIGDKGRVIESDKSN